VLATIPGASWDPYHAVLVVSLVVHSYAHAIGDIPHTTSIVGSMDGGYGASSLGSSIACACIPVMASLAVHHQIPPSLVHSVGGGVSGTAT
jgi:hypothetical protein